MNEIFKGMDNAAEQINENFEELQLKDVSDTFTLLNAVSVDAYQMGKVLILRIDTGAVPRDWTDIATTTLKTLTSFSLSVHKTGYKDRPVNISAGITSTGVVQVSSDAPMQHPLIISGTIILE